MSWEPGVVEAFTAFSGGETRLEDLHVSLAAVLISRALNVGYGPVISEGVPALTRDRISHVDQNYMRAETIGPANAPLFKAQGRTVPAREYWGGGLVRRRTGSATWYRCAACRPARTPSTSDAARRHLAGSGPTGYRPLRVRDTLF